MTSEARSEAPRLTADERDELLRLAQAAIASVLQTGTDPTLRLSTNALLAPGGAFVTLHSHGRLRGCVGSAFPRDALYRTAIKMARAAACDDPRFPPLTAAELGKIDIEISRLTEPRQAAPGDVVPGRHGLYILRGPNRGLLLPQVAVQYGWQREQFLQAACHKAGLADEAWREPETQILIFEAEVFGKSPES